MQHLSDRKRQSRHGVQNYIAVSVANGCGYCIHSYTASARARGMTDAQHGVLMAVIAMASQTNVLATALQIEPDDRFCV